MEQEIAAGAGPADGHPLLMSSYRTELGGLLAVLYIIHRICHHYQVTQGQAKCYCDNKGAVTNTFAPRQRGITPFLNTDYDLIHLAQGLVQIIPVTIIGEWVKGHYTGPQREYKHVLNHRVDRLATRFQQRQSHRFTTLRKPLAPPDFRICLLMDNSVITSKYYTKLATAMHNKPMEEYIMKKTKWTLRTFHKVDWLARERAYKRLTRNQKIGTTKLIHNLANTNRQNHLFYGTTNLCPGCHSLEETFEHVLKCNCRATTEHRDECLKVLEANLAKISTPVPLINTI
jgi:hypothetical protein